MRAILAALLACLWLASPANADISFVSAAELGNNNTSGTTFSGSFTTSSSANRILVAFVIISDNGVVTPSITVTYNGVSMAGPYGAEDDSGGEGAFFILVNPPSGSNTLLVTDTNCGGTNCFIQAEAAEYAGAAQTGQPDTTGAWTRDGSANDTYSTTVGPTVANRAWVIGAATSGGGGTPADSMSAPFTARINNGGASFVIMGDAGPITPAGSVTFAATIQNSGSAQNHHSFSIAPAAVLTDKGSMMMMGCCR
jgi:hypothetical protein